MYSNYTFSDFLKNYTNICPQQFGYRPNTSTLLATNILKDTFTNFLKKDSSVYAWFLDPNKAFKRVDHVLLINKLLRDKVPTFIVNILRTVFSKREVGSFSNSWQVRQGVRQGGVLSAYLFTYYIDDILKRVVKEDIGCRVVNNKLNILAYADDIVLIFRLQVAFESLLRVLGECVVQHNLVLNVTKTKVMVFRNKKTPVFNNLSFYLSGWKLENVNSFKYLGCILILTWTNLFIFCNVYRLLIRALDSFLESFILSI